MSVHAAHVDDNQQFSIIGVVGTLGTADVRGTAKTLPVGVNPDTGALYVDVMDTEFNVGTLTVGTINQIGTITAGTIEDRNLDIRIEDADATTTYYGYAPLGQGTNTAGNVWRVLRKTYDATSSVYMFAGGTDTFTNPWDGRGTLTYT